MIRSCVPVLLCHSSPFPFSLAAFLLCVVPLGAQGVDRGWITVTNERGAFSVTMPRDTQSATVRSPKGRGDSVELFMTTASLPDRSQFAVVYNDPVADNVILDEEASLSTMRKRLISAMSGGVLRSTPIIHEGYPGSEIVMAVGENARVYCRAFQRGDRTYGLVARVGTHPTDSVAAMRMLGSLHFLPFRKATWRPFSSRPLRFTASFPSSPIEAERSSMVGDGSSSPWRTFGATYARDPGSGLLYTVMAGRFNISFHADDTASLFDALTQRFLRTDDAIVEKKDLRVDGFASREIIARHAADHTLRRLRMVLHGEDFFVLSLVAPPEESRSDAANGFFDSFHPTGPVIPIDLFSSVLPPVLAAIDGRDPATAASARAELERMRLGRRDNPTIYAVLQHPRGDDTLGPRGVRGLLIRALSYAPDSATIGFLDRLLPTLPARGGLRAATITYIAWIGTAEALDTAAELLARYRGDLEGREIDPFLTLRDHPEKGARVLPRFFPLLDVPEVRSSVLSLAESLLRAPNGATAIAPAIPAFAAGMHAAIARRGAGVDSAMSVDALAGIIALAGTMPPSDSIDAVLRAAAREGERSLRREATLALARRKASIPAEALETLAADPRQALLLFEGLASLGRPDLFPTRFRDQRVIGTSKAVVELEKSGAFVDSIAVVEVRELTYDNAPHRFLLLRYRIAGRAAWLPAVVGPFPLTATNLDPGAAELWTDPAPFAADQAAGYFQSALGWLGARRSVR